jgi:hypothetical protein
MAANPPTDHFSALPVELLLKVLIHLPVKDLCRCRKLCKQLKKVIDANLKSLLEPAIIFHQDRLTAYCNNVLDTTGVEFITALSRFISYYGKIEDKAAGSDVLMSFCRLYTRQNYPALSNHDRTHLYRDTLYRVARLCVQGIATHQHSDDFDGDQGVLNRGSLSSWLHHRAAGTGDFSLIDLMYMWEKLNIRAGLSSKMCDGVPPQFVTRRLSHTRDSKGYWGAFHKAPKWLGVPKLPGRTIFAYCMNNHALGFRLQCREYPSDTTPPLFVKAAILEELFIW